MIQKPTKSERENQLIKTRASKHFFFHFPEFCSFVYLILYSYLCISFAVTQINLLPNVEKRLHSPKALPKKRLQIMKTKLVQDKAAPENGHKKPMTLVSYVCYEQNYNKDFFVFTNFYLFILGQPKKSNTKSRKKKK